MVLLQARVENVPAARRITPLTILSFWQVAVAHLASVCSLSPNASGIPAKHTLFGHNQINGAVFLSEFNAPGVEASARALWSGMLRYPGGTLCVATLPHATPALVFSFSALALTLPPPS